jgi:holo-[acyl-carrier protein] synthase
MITGIGIDFIEVKRIRDLAEKSPRFLEKIFTPVEIAYCSKKRNKYQNYAARFAAKEAFFKAVGKRVHWKDVELVNLPSGEPRLEMKAGQKWPFTRAHVSVTHLAEHAMAIVILEKS